MSLRRLFLNVDGGKSEHDDSYHTQENRGFSIVKSTQRWVVSTLFIKTVTSVFRSRLFWYAVFETICVIGMAVYVNHLDSSNGALTRASACRYTFSKHSSRKLAGDIKFRVLPYLKFDVIMITFGIPSYYIFVWYLSSPTTSKWLCCGKDGTWGD